MELRRETISIAKVDWLGGRDLNPDMLVQSQLSYR